MWKEPWQCFDCVMAILFWVPKPYQKMKQHVKCDGEGVFFPTMLLNRIVPASCHNSIHFLETPFTMKAANDEPRDRAILLGRHPAGFI